MRVVVRQGFYCIGVATYSVTGAVGSLNGVARIFFLGGPPGTFSVISPGTDRIQWGRGGSSRNFSRKLINPIPSIPGHFFDIFGPPADHPPFVNTHANSGTLPRSAYTFEPRNNIN